MTKNERNYMEMTFPSNEDNGIFAGYVVRVFATQLGATIDELSDINTVVREAVTNVIAHAYPDTVGKVSVRATIFDDNVIEIKVRDWGCGIENVEKARQPLFSTAVDRTGMGFTIMESFMDSVKVRSKPDKGTTVTMRRRISAKKIGQK